MKASNSIFKKLHFFFIFTLYSIICSAQVGINTTAPKNGSMLDIESIDKGIFIPKVDIVDLNTIDPITGVGLTAPELAAAEGLMVYNTNGTTGKGFYYWTGTNWSPISPAEDADFFKVGTTTAPTAITDNVFRTGKVSIGKTTAGYALDVRNDVDERVAQITSYGNGDGDNYGLFINQSNDGVGTHYGMRINVSYTETTGSHRHYGSYNQVDGTATGTNQNIGSYNTTKIGSGEHTGVYNSLSGTENSTNVGTLNFITNSGNGTHTGVSNTLLGNGIGDHIGVSNNINSAKGNVYGVKTDINNTASGQTSYGTYNNLYNGSGTSYAGYFTAGGTGTNYAAVFFDGHVVVNESGNDNDFRIEGGTNQNLFFVDASTDNVGIGTNVPSEKLEVSGKIKAVDINFSGLPVFADEAAATTGGLAKGDVYQTLTGELRIKL